MRIAIVTETFLPSTDGIVTRLINAIRYMKQQGHDILVIAPDLGKVNYLDAKIAGIRSINLPFYKSRGFSLPSANVKKILENFKPDVVHAVNPLLLAASGVKYAKKLGIPLIASYHTNIPKYLRYYNFHGLAESLLWAYILHQHKQSLINLCTSNSIKEELEAHNIPNLHVLKRGVDTINRHPRFYDADMRSRLLHGNNDKHLLIFVGRLAAEKEIHKIKPLLKARDDISLAIIGDGPEREKLEKEFQGTHTVFTGFLHGEELSKAYASADAFIFPSVTETLGLVILEAMSSGLPVIAAESGPTLEQVKHMENGLIFQNEDLKSMENAVKLLDDKELLQTMKKNARREAEQISWDKASQQLLDFYYKTVYIHNFNCI
ncbi:glycosyltransferase family 4 protein [Clostridium pasteurianum]|uniref:Glycosyltransferase n=1 Tax=Clostridium pasteurianum BC1 TaxID=86416 RepID=R4K212_CLOPA|nr:glycosyltransferase family 1 protein [Clostridium pasteurianum]AGK95811.1 glycosyltransferase [Clostridium pasteurianum BC1]